jgi:1-acyl-sn-glycerol-3-phosphate acyltransferase
MAVAGRALDYGLDDDRVAPPEPLAKTVRRRFGGRYPTDPWGLDPQVCDLFYPAIAPLVRIEMQGDEHIPRTGAAVLVSNRGFGVAEPAVLTAAVRSTVQRRLRMAGLPSLPLVSGFARRLGAIVAEPRDVAGVVRAGHLVGVTLAPTWLRTGAGTPPLPLVGAMTRAPVIPVAVKPGGPLGTAVRPWRVRVGPPVVLDEPLEPGDPLAAAQLAEHVRDAVAALLTD